MIKKTKCNQKLRDLMSQNSIKVNTSSFIKRTIYGEDLVITLSPKLKAVVKLKEFNLMNLDTMVNETLEVG